MYQIYLFIFKLKVKFLIGYDLNDAVHLRYTQYKCKRF